MAEHTVRVVIELTPLGKSIIRFAHTLTEQADDLPETVVEAMRDLVALEQEQRDE